jgi:hypothetical protein
MNPFPLIDGTPIPPQAHGWWMAFLEKILSWGLLGLALFALLFALAIALIYAMKWLLSRTEGSGQRTKTGSSRFAALWASLSGACRKIFRGAGGYQKAAELYGAFLRWADRSGFPHDHMETPTEFGMRLNTRYPAMKPSIERIIDAYNREVYGETVISGASLAEANAAWQFLRSPLRWPARFKGWFAGSSTGEET